MATNNSTSDIEILVGVQGGESINEGSGKEISSTLKKIAQNISQQKLIKVTVGADQTTTKRAIQQVLNQSDLKLHNVGFGNNVANSLQSQLAKMGLTIDIEEANIKEAEKQVEDAQKRIDRKRKSSRRTDRTDYQKKNETKADTLRVQVEKAYQKTGDRYNADLASGYEAAIVALDKYAARSKKQNAEERAAIELVVEAFKSKAKAAEKNVESRSKKLGDIRASINFDVDEAVPESIRTFVESTENELSRLEGIVNNAMSGVANVNVESIDAQIDELVASISAFDRQQENFAELAAYQDKCEVNQKRITDAIKDSGAMADRFADKIKQFEYGNDNHVKFAESDILELNTLMLKIKDVPDEIKLKDGSIASTKKANEEYEKLINTLIEYAGQTRDMTATENEQYKRKKKWLNDYVSDFVKAYKKMAAEAAKVVNQDADKDAEVMVPQGQVNRWIKSLETKKLDAGNGIMGIKEVADAWEKAQAAVNEYGSDVSKQGPIEAASVQALIKSLDELISKYKKLEKANSPENRANSQASAKKALADFNAYLTTLKPKALIEFGDSIARIRSLLSDGTPEACKKAKIAINDLKGDMKRLGYEGGNIFTYLEGKIKTFAIYLVSSELTNKFVEGIGKVISTVSELDGGLTNLRIVTNGTKNETKELLQTYNSMAQQLGATTASTIESAVEWQRQGYDIQETNELVKDSMVLSVVGMVNSADAAQYLTSAIKGNREIPCTYRNVRNVHI